MHKCLYNQLFFKVIAILFALLILPDCHSQKKLSTDGICSTKYPILLVHGVAYRDDVWFLKYWSNLPKALEKNGAKVYIAHQQAFNSHVDNALILRERVLEILDETGSKKVNIIAHSKGGIESRYLISKLDMADKVASLTTLATPHRGSYIADTLLIWLNKKQWLKKVIKRANFYARFIGDKNPDALNSADNLTIEYMQDFNQSVPDVAQVYYQSYGGVIGNEYPAWMLRLQQKILAEKEGDNDGIVSINSYKWGNFRGIVNGNQECGVSHFDIVGIKLVSLQNNFDAKSFFINIARDLKERGF